MAKNVGNVLQTNPGMVMVVTYAAMFVVNAIGIYFANMFFPANIVLGTFSMNSWWAIFHSASMLSLILTLAVPFVAEIEKWKQREFTPAEWMASFFVLNFVSVWLIARFSDQFGLGISAWYIAAGLAFVLNLIQGLVMMQVEKIRKS